MISLRILCPSARCDVGALLIGVVQRDARIALIGKPLVVDEDFVRVARNGRPPEKRFRFASPCIREGCKQWSQGRCGVIDGIRHDLPEVTPTGELPACAIRPQCRWFAQLGASACAVCPEVITDLKDDACPPDLPASKQC